MLEVKKNHSNELSFLLHNFTGFLTLDRLLRDVYRNTPSRYKFIVFSGNVVKFEYKYKFDTINLRALKPKENELYIYVDFGIKGILQYNSKEFYLQDKFDVQTSDRVYALFRSMDRHFDDKALVGYPLTTNNLYKLIVKHKIKSPVFYSLFNSKFFIEETFIKGFFFKYNSFIEQLCLHYSLLNFYMIYLNTSLFSYYSKINLNEAFIVYERLQNCLEKFFYTNDFLQFGYFWKQKRINDRLRFKHQFHLKISPPHLRSKFLSWKYRFKRLRKRKGEFKFKVKLNKKSKILAKLKVKNIRKNIFLRQPFRVKRKKLKRRRRFKISFLNVFFDKFKKRYWNKKKRNSVLIAAWKKYYIVKNLRYRGKWDRTIALRKSIWPIANAYKLKYPEHQFDFYPNYPLNRAKISRVKRKKHRQTNNLVYVDKGLILRRSEKYFYKTRAYRSKPLFNIRKKVYIIKKALRKFKIFKFNHFFRSKNLIKNLKFKNKKKKRRFLHLKFGKLFTGGKLLKKRLKKSKNKSLILSSSNIKKTISKRSLIKMYAKYISTKQFFFKSWINRNFDYALANYLGELPKGFNYVGYVKHKMFLFYKKFLSGVSLKVTIFNSILKYFWLASYFSTLVKRNFLNTQVFRHKNCNNFMFKVNLDKYLVNLTSAFIYPILIRLKILDIMTKQNPIARLNPKSEESKMKFYWRVANKNFVPKVKAYSDFFDRSNWLFVSFSLNFLIVYYSFIFHKRFYFSIGHIFWKKILLLRNIFQLLFIKKTNFTLNFYRQYFVLFFNLINKNRKLFVTFLFYVLKYKLNTYRYSLNNLLCLNITDEFSSIKQLCFGLKKFMAKKSNFFGCFFSYFFNFFSIYNVTQLFHHNKNKTYQNYKFFSNKLFLSINKKNNIFFKEKKLLSHDKNKEDEEEDEVEAEKQIFIQPMFLTITSLRRILSYKQLFCFWDWTFFNNPIHDKLDTKHLILGSIISSSFLNSFFMYNRRTNYKLKNDRFSFRKQGSLFFNKNECVFSHVEKKKMYLGFPRYFSVQSSKGCNTLSLMNNKINSVLKYSIFRGKLIRFTFNNVKKTKRISKYFVKFYRIFSIFSRYKRFAIKSYFSLLKRRLRLKLFLISKNRLIFLFKQLFSSKNIFDFFSGFLVYLKKYLLFLGFSLSYVIFFCNSLSVLLHRMQVSINLRTIYIIFSSFFYSLLTKAKYYNKLMFLKKFKNTFILFYNNVRFFSHPTMLPKNQQNYLMLFIKRMNVLFFTNTKNIFKIFCKQHYKLFVKYKEQEQNILNVSVKKPSVFISRKNQLSNNNNLISDFSNLFNFKLFSISFLKRCTNVLINSGFIFFSRLSVLKLLFFPFLANKGFFKQNFDMVAFGKKLHKFYQYQCKSLYTYDFKRIRFLLFSLNRLFYFLAKKKAVTKNNFKILKKSFMFNTFCLFRVIFRNNRYLKKVYYKHTYPFFFSKKEKINVKKTLFLRKFSLKLIKKGLIRFIILNNIPKRTLNFKKRLKLYYLRLLKIFFTKVETVSDKVLIKKIFNSAFKASSINRKYIYILVNKLKKVQQKKTKGNFIKKVDYKQEVSFLNSFYSLIRIIKKWRLVKYYKYNLKKLFLKKGLKYSSFFYWLFIYGYFKVKTKYSMFNLLHSKGLHKNINKRTFFYYYFYSLLNPFKKRAKFIKIAKSLKDLNGFTRYEKELARMKQVYKKRYIHGIPINQLNVDSLTGNFFRRAFVLCLTPKKQKHIENKNKKIFRIVRRVIPFWRVLLSKRKRPTIVRGDFVATIKMVKAKARKKWPKYLARLRYLLWGYTRFSKGRKAYFPSFSILVKKRLYNFIKEKKSLINQKIRNLGKKQPTSVFFKEVKKLKRRIWKRTEMQLLKQNERRFMPKKSCISSKFFIKGLNKKYLTRNILNKNLLDKEIKDLDLEKVPADDDNKAKPIISKKQRKLKLSKFFFPEQFKYSKKYNETKIENRVKLINTSVGIRERIIDTYRAYLKRKWQIRKLTRYFLIKKIGRKMLGVNKNKKYHLKKHKKKNTYSKKFHSKNFERFSKKSKPNSTRTDFSYKKKRKKKEYKK